MKGLPVLSLRLRGIAVGMAALAVCAFAVAQDDETIALSDAGFAAPESVLFDEEGDVYLVSNINGSPLEVDGNGFISRVSPDGEVQELRWIDGESEGVELDAPKGMAISNGVLYVADITMVRMYDRETGEPMGDAAVEGADFLNDVTPHPDGGVLVTDTGVGPDFQPTGNAAVYRVMEDGTVEQFASLSDFGMPNGIVGTDDGHFVVVTLAEPGQVIHLSSDGEVESSDEFESGGFDGVVQLDNGDLLVSSWGAGGIVRISGEGEATTVIEGYDSPADIDFDAGRNMVLIPLLQGNEVHFVPLPEQE